MSEFTIEEKEILKKYFSSVTSDIFCIINLPEVIKGTLFSRYSRTTKSVRRLFLDEFYHSEIGGLLQGKEVVTTTGVDTAKAEDFYERILVGYGDDSVAELGGVHIALENISNIAAKLVEDARIGISPLEKSSRYVFYDQKVKGKYRYYRDDKIMKSSFGKKYEQTMDLLFDTYSLIVRDIFGALIKEGKPEEVSEIAFKASCKAKACDVARYLLPMGTLTNVGLYGNGRAFEYMIIKLQAQMGSESKDLTKKMVNELKKVVGAFIKRSYNERGIKYATYLNEVNKVVKAVAEKKMLARVQNSKPGINEIKLIYSEKDAEDKVIAGLLYPYSNMTFEEVLKRVQKLGTKTKEQIVKDTVAKRANRHHKPFRGFEQANYTFDITSDIGAFRDVHRHRMLSQQRQNYTTELGYNVPEELSAFPELRQKYDYALKQADVLYRAMKTKMSFEAQYVVPFACRINYYFSMNLREAVHFAELRSTSQGHPSYRYLAQEIARQIGKKHKLFGKYVFPFVDYKSYKLDRLQAFERIARKAHKLGVKAFDE